MPGPTSKRADRSCKHGQIQAAKLGYGGGGVRGRRAAAKLARHEVGAIRVAVMIGGSCRRRLATAHVVDIHGRVQSAAHQRGAGRARAAASGGFDSTQRDYSHADFQMFPEIPLNDRLWSARRLSRTHTFDGTARAFRKLISAPRRALGGRSGRRNTP